ncbi:MAG: hypothetical protein RLZZ59_20 [Pseudomonadota bacterium]|jgi:putative Holliday junction resolvase
MIIDSLQDFCSFLNKISPILAIDLGEKKLGFSISDHSYKMALPAYVVKVSSEKDKIEAIVSAIMKYKACALVVGIPFNMNGSESEQTTKIRKFAQNLAAKIALPIYLQDERLTSRAAHSLLKETGMKRRERDAVDDSVAASLILDTVIQRINII